MGHLDQERRQLGDTANTAAVTRRLCNIKSLMSDQEFTAVRLAKLLSVSRCRRLMDYATCLMTLKRAGVETQEQTVRRGIVTQGRLTPSET